MIRFTAELVLPAGYVIACCQASIAHAPRYGTYEDATAALRDDELFRLVDDAPRPVLPGCDLPDVCPDYGWDVHPVYADPAPEVEVSQVHAAVVLGALGYPVPEVPDAFAAVDLAGIEDATVFEGRVLTALALAPADAGMPAYDDTGETGPRWFKCGRRPGYLQEKLTALAEVARWCREHGRRVHWT